MRLSTVLPVLTLAACSGSLDPVGVFETSAEAFAAVGFERALPADTDTAAFARARFAEQPAVAAPWNATLELRADRTFGLTVQLTATLTQQRTGTWSLDGAEVKLTTTARDGQPVAPPLVQTATLTPDSVQLQLAAASPLLVLQRRAHRKR